MSKSRNRKRKKRIAIREIDEPQAQSSTQDLQVGKQTSVEIDEPQAQLSTEDLQVGKQTSVEIDEPQAQLSTEDLQVGKHKFRLAIWAPIILIVLGFATYFTGMNGKFMPDDVGQITANPIIQSPANIVHFFSGSTYFNGATLVGNYYRPIMATVFSVLYSIFGANPIPFHVFQLTLYILGVILVFMLLKYSFKPILAFGLAMLFLVHPINSQVVYSISAMQDILFFDFGMLAMLILLRFNSTRSMILAIICLFCSLLSKEAGVLFVFMSLVYLYLVDRERLWRFIKLLTIPMVVYFALRINAIGLSPHPHEAPIDNLALWGRLATTPSILLFYIYKFIWPVKLASGYYWSYSNLSIDHFLLPLIIDLLVVGLVIYGARVVRRHLPENDYFTYWFFAIWATVGLAIVIQIVPLDMTACTNWILFSMVGLLGMLGEIIKAKPWQSSSGRHAGIFVFIILIAIFSLGSALRGYDWKNQVTLAKRDISASSDDYLAYNTLASYQFSNGDYQQTKTYAEDANAIFPTYISYAYIGNASLTLGDYANALSAYKSGLKFSNYEGLYDGIAGVTTVYGDYQSNAQMLAEGLKVYPQDSKLWLAVAIIEFRNGGYSAAKYAITQSANYGPVSSTIYNAVMNEQPFTIQVGPRPQTVK